MVLFLALNRLNWSDFVWGNLDLPEVCTCVVQVSFMRKSCWSSLNCWIWDLMRFACTLTNSKNVCLNYDNLLILVDIFSIKGDGDTCWHEIPLISASIQMSLWWDLPELILERFSYWEYFCDNSVIWKCYMPICTIYLWIVAVYIFKLFQNLFFIH